MTLNDKERAMLTTLVDGAYGSEIPNDDETTATLTRCVELSWVIWEPALRGDDFFIISPHGRQMLKRS